MVATAAIILGLSFCYPLLTGLTQASGFSADWDQHLGFSWYGYTTIAHFKQVPLWNPYRCGGLAEAGNPQSQVFAPSTLLHLIAGPIAGAYLEIPLHFAMAWAGTYVLASVLGLGWIAAAGAATVFPAASWFALHSAMGHLDLLSFAYVPWALAFALRATRTEALIDVALAGLALALTFLDGSPYPTIYAGFIMGTVMLVRAIRERSFRPLTAMLLAIAFGAGFMAIKLVPAIEFMREHPRAFARPEYATLGSLRDVFARNQDLLKWRPSPQRWGFWEFGCYIGLFAVPALIGIVAGGLGGIEWTIAAGLMLVLWCGSRGSYWPWALIHHMPLLAALRAPQRSIIAFALACAIVAGFGLDFIRSKIPKYGKVVAAAIVIVATLDCWLVSSPAYRYVVSTRESEAPEKADGFQQLYRSWPGHELNYARNGFGVIMCYEETQWATNVRGYDELSYKGEQYLNGDGKLQLLEWTPNVLEFEVDVAQPTDLIINQNFQKSWRLRSGAGSVFEFGFLPPSELHSFPIPGQLAVHLPAGHQRIKLRYLPSTFAIGAIITVLSFGLLAWIIVRARAVAG